MSQYHFLKFSSKHFPKNFKKINPPVGSCSRYGAGTISQTIGRHLYGNMHQKFTYLSLKNPRCLTISYNE